MRRIVCMLRRVAICCSVLQCVAVCCSVLQCAICIASQRVLYASAPWQHVIHKANTHTHTHTGCHHFVVQHTPYAQQTHTHVACLGSVVQLQVTKTHRMPYLYRSFSAKEPHNEWLFCGKMTCNFSHPMSLCHPVHVIRVDPHCNTLQHTATHRNTPQHTRYTCSKHTHTSEVFAKGWLRLVGSFKLKVSFAKEPYKRDDILQ